MCRRALCIQSEYENCSFVFKQYMVDTPSICPDRLACLLYEFESYNKNSLILGLTVIVSEMYIVYVRIDI